MPNNSTLTFIRSVGPGLLLYRCLQSGVAFIFGDKFVDGCAHSKIAGGKTAELNVQDMIERGSWSKSDTVYDVNGYHVNIDVRCTDRIEDQIAAEHCFCIRCQEK